MQLHLALQQLYVEPLHQLLIDFTLLGFKAREAQVELAFLLFGRISQGLHNPVDHLAHVLSHHRGPFRLLCRCNLGCGSHNCLALHQLVDRKVASGYERHNVLDGCLHFE